MGRLGAMYARVGTTDLSNVALAQVGSSDEYVIADAATRIERAFAEGADVSDFTPSSGTITALKKPVGGVVINGGTPPYALSSANGAATILRPVGGLLNWRLEVDADVMDITALGAEHRVYRRLQRGWEASAERFWLDENFTVDVAAQMNAVGDAPFNVSFFVNTDSDKYYRYAGFATVEGLNLDAPADGIVEETIRFKGQDALYFRRASD